MNKTNTQKLLKAFPGLYADYDQPLKPAMPWGFECGDGWLGLIWQLSADIESEARQAGLDPDSEQWPRANQVKEKFGRLRFYLNHGSEAIYAHVRRAEEKSYTVCEQCGLTGTLRSEGWWRTICDVCEAIREQERKKRVGDIE